MPFLSIPLWVDDHLLPWPGRALDDDRADPLIAAETSRARKTYAAVRHLVLGGYGPQAAMLVRSLFEGTVCAHWAHANPERAMEMFALHGRHDEILWADARRRVGWDEEDEPDAATEEERTKLADLFGAYGHRPWTGHRNLIELVRDVEHLWPGDQHRADLWTYYRVVHHDNNRILHSGFMALAGSARLSENMMVFDSGPSAFYVDRAMFGAYWCYVQTVTLLWDHFGLDGREDLSTLLRDPASAYNALAADETKGVGRNDPCPCGSGKKFKKCHGA